MTFFQIVVLAFIQGLTEFLPVSSSGHLILVPLLTGWKDQGLIFDVSVHVGTLGAVLFYFWRDVREMILGLFKGLNGRPDQGTRMALSLVVATLPVVGVGYVINSFAESLRSALSIGIMALTFGTLLYMSDRWSRGGKRLEDISYRYAFFMGLAQSVALIPGVSRSGIVINTARAIGFERRDAARYAFLMSIPAIVGAGTLTGYELYQSGEMFILGHDVMIAAVLSFLFSILGIHIMMRWVQTRSLTPFVVYRLGLGFLLLGLVWFGFVQCRATNQRNRHS